MTERSYLWFRAELVLLLSMLAVAVPVALAELFVRISGVFVADSFYTTVSQPAASPSNNLALIEFNVTLPDSAWAANGAAVDEVIRTLRMAVSLAHRQLPVLIHGFVPNSCAPAGGWGALLAHCGNLSLDHNPNLVMAVGKGRGFAGTEGFERGGASSLGVLVDRVRRPDADAHSVPALWNMCVPSHCDEYLQRCMWESESIIEEAFFLPRHEFTNPSLFVQPRGSVSTVHTDAGDSYFQLHLVRGEKTVRVWPTGTALYEVAGEPTEADWHLARLSWPPVLLSRFLTWFARLGASSRFASRYLINEYIPSHCKWLSEWLGCESHHCSDSWIGHGAGGAREPIEFTMQDGDIFLLPANSFHAVLTKQPSLVHARNAFNAWKSEMMYRQKQSSRPAMSKVARELLRRVLRSEGRLTVVGGHTASSHTLSTAGRSVWEENDGGEEFFGAGIWTAPINWHEFRRGFAAHGLNKKALRKDIAVLFASLDLDQSGIIDPEELDGALTAVGDQHHERQRASEIRKYKVHTRYVYSGEAEHRLRAACINAMRRGLLTCSFRNQQPS